MHSILINLKNYFLHIFNSDYFFGPFLIEGQTKKIILITLAGILVIAAIIKFNTLFRLKNRPPNIKLSEMIFNWLITIVVIGLILFFFNIQEISTFAKRFWWWFLGLLFLVWGGIILIYRLKKFPNELFKFNEIKRKEKYLPKSGKRG